MRICGPLHLFRWLAMVAAVAAVNVMLVISAAPAGAAVYPVEVSPTSGPPGTVVTVSGEACEPGILFDASVLVTATFVSTSPVTAEIEDVNADGSWSTEITVPEDAAAAPASIGAVCFEGLTPSLTTTYSPATFSVTSPPASTTTTTSPPASTTTTTSPAAPTTTNPATPTSTAAAPTTTASGTVNSSTPGSSSPDDSNSGGGGSPSDPDSDTTSAPNSDDRGGDQTTGTEVAETTSGLSSGRSGSVIGTDGGPGMPYDGPIDVDVVRGSGGTGEVEGVARYVSDLDDLELTGSSRGSSWLDGLAWLLALLVAAAGGAIGLWYRRVRNSHT